MGWFLGILLFIFILWLVVVSPAFRILTIGLLILIGVGIWWYIENEKRRSKLSLQLITREELEISNISMQESYGSWKLSGKMKNLSKNHTLSSVLFEITAYDCPEKQINNLCEIIGEDTVSAYIGIPPGQVRSFDEYAHFSNMPTPRHLMWRYKVGAVRARVYGVLLQTFT